MKQILVSLLFTAVCGAQTFEQRAEDLLKKMTLEEKVSQMMNDSPAIDRLGIPAYNWWNECLHGVARAGRATVFPQAIGMAATWDTNLMFRIGTAISDEARAKHHEFVRRGKRNIYQGLTFWTPNINLFRDPRWGRGMETYGEDPYLTGRMAVQFIKALQGDDPKYLKSIATAKHYAVHSGPESIRHSFDAVVSEEDLRNTYLPQFEMAIKEAKAESVMCAYNRVDGAPACASPMLLEDILRKEWGFKGYVVSDCGAISDIYRFHKTEPNAETGVAKAVKSGTDLDCGGEYSALTRSVNQGLISESEIDTSVRRLLLARFRLGMFDPPSQVKWARIPYSVNENAEHHKLALEAARKSIVLLKNDKNTLPFGKSLKTIAVIGPNADEIDSLLGNYNGEPSAPVTPLAGLKARKGVKVIYARGSDHADGLPRFEVIPSSALLTPDKKPGLLGEYFNVCGFDGKGYRPRERASGVEAKPLFSRVDATVDFKWWDGAPRADLKDDDFGVRWTGFVTAPVSGKYQLGAIGMNAAELYLDGKRIVNFNNLHERSYSWADVDLEAGKQYAIRLDFHEYVNDADIRLVWSKPRSGEDAGEAVKAAQAADAVVMVMGLSPRLEGEEMRVPVAGFQGGDRVDIGLPKVQQALMEKIVAVGKPVVLVLMNGSSLGVTWAKENVPAIVELWYPGQAGGTALADVLFGDFNPGGRLPVTFYKSADQLPAFTDYSMKGRTYRYFEGEPLFPFGYGLSYTSFAYSNAVRDGDRVAVEVRNSGRVAGEEVVQLYVHGWQNASRSLIGFQRIALKAGERRRVEFALDPKKAAGHELSVGSLRIQ